MSQIQAPSSIVQQQEVNYLSVVIECLTKGFYKSAGLKRTNLGNSIKPLIRKGIISSDMFATVKDPHSKKTRIAVVNHDLLITRLTDMTNHWLGIGRTMGWINNMLHHLTFSAVFYKYSTLQNISHPHIAGLLANAHNSRSLRDRARKNGCYILPTNIL